MLVNAANLKFLPYFHFCTENKWKPFNLIDILRRGGAEVENSDAKFWYMWVVITR